MKSRLAIIFPVVVILLITLACGVGSKTSSNSAEPSNTATPRPTPTQTLAPSGPCVNVFYPFVPGYQWIYKSDDGDDATDDAYKVGLTVSNMEGTQAQIDALDLSTGIITHTTVECQDGAIKNYPLLTVGTLFGNVLIGEINVEYVSGVFMPAERDLAAANWITTWTGDYKANGTFTVTEDGEITTVALNDSPIQMEWSLVGQEPITVEAGTFADAYKVTRKATVDVNIEAEGVNIQAKLIVNTNQWYAAGIGLLKSEVDSASMGYMGFTFPAQIKSRVELVEFRAGQ